MNERNAIINLWNKISNLVDTKTANLKYDKTFKSTVWKVNDDNTYQINYMGQLYNVPSAIGVLSLGESVWVIIPSGILRNMFIYGSKRLHNKNIDYIGICNIKLSDDTTFEPLEID